MSYINIHGKIIDKHRQICVYVLCLYNKIRSVEWENTFRWKVQKSGGNSPNGLSFAISLATRFVCGYYGLSGIIGIVLSAIDCSKAVRNGEKTGVATTGIINAIGNFVPGIYMVG